MTVRNKEGLVESCVLVAEINGYNYYYNVALPDIERSIRAIQAAYDYYNMMCTKIYISGFTLVNESTNLSPEGIVEKVANNTCFHKVENTEGVSFGR